MRPQGEIRRALADAAEQLAEEKGGATWRDLAETAQVGYAKARMTVKDMARAGDLEPIGAEKRAHSRRWMTLYAPRQGGFATATTGQALDAITRAWVR